MPFNDGGVPESGHVEVVSYRGRHGRHAEFEVDRTSRLAIRKDFKTVKGCSRVHGSSIGGEEGRA